MADMSAHLRFSGLSFDEQRAALIGVVTAEPTLMRVLDGMRVLGLPDCWLVSGAIYNTAWNVLTGRDSLQGVKDIDLFYHDASDLSYEAEDREIRRASRHFANTPVPVELRNQARVHLWYRDHFGQDRAPLTSSRHAISEFAARTHAVGIRLTHDGDAELFAPFGLNDLFAFRHAPNRVLDNRQTYERKSARIAAIWPEVTVEPW